MTRQRTSATTLDWASLSPVEALAARSNLLGADRSIANFGGGNTSAKTREVDHAGRQLDVLWVKGSGSDLATIGPLGFTGLRLAEVLLLRERSAMSDEEMVAYLARCQLAPAMPRCSIETLLHAFVPHAHVDHTHPDAIGAIVGAADGAGVAAEVFGAEAIWIPYLRPGFALSKLVGDAVAARPAARFVLLAKHGLVTWGDTAEASYAATLEAIERAAAVLPEGAAAFGGPRRPPLDDARRQAALDAVLPVVRGAASAVGAPKVLCADDAPAVLELVASRAAPTLTQVGAACPDHLVHTKRRPLFVPYDPERDDLDVLRARVADGVRSFAEAEGDYFARHAGADDEPADPAPRVVLVEGVGLIAVGRSVQAATLARDLYHRAIEVMRGAEALGGFVSLDDAEAFAVEHWPLELYKLSLAPPPRELAGRVAFVTGGAGGIGSAVVHRLADAGAVVVVADVDGDGADAVAERHGAGGLAARMDVTREADVADAFRAAVRRYGGVDVVVSNAGAASSAAIEDTSVADWDFNHDVLARGYFLVAREAFRLLKRQGTGGAIVFVGSKNSLAAGRNASAYSAAKAAELHLARCLAEEGGPFGIRVNTVNPDAVIQGSRIWDSSWRAERAANYGIAPEELEEHYRARTTLKVSVLPDDVAEAVLHFASGERSAKSTGNILNVDGGVAAAYPR